MNIQLISFYTGCMLLLFSFVQVLKACPKMHFNRDPSKLGAHMLILLPFMDIFWMLLVLCKGFIFCRPLVKVSLLLSLALIFYGA